MLLVQQKTVVDWETEYLVSSKAKRFIPTISKHLKCKYFSSDFKLTQVLTSHGNFRSYLFRFSIVGSGFRACGDAMEDVEHISLH